ncbi:hypothetical protein ACFOST_02180 [Cytobacillus kochii]|uniref:hypothetical protein n=1 Tax=Cytobacillus kochii TaxID=859143 RepID=UPI00278ACAA2|nr:hypothetical protein [Cytobacillus kochii]MDQ0183879.1 hypothetical protein [Cytobacillus kochii]
MKKQDWKDDHIEELLKQLPKITNHISKQDMYQQMMIFKEQKKRKRWLTPSVASAVAVLLLCILVPTMINFQDSAGSNIDDSEQENQLASNATQQKEVNDEITNDESNHTQENTEDIVKDEEVTPQEDIDQTDEIYAQNDQSEEANANDNNEQPVTQQIEPTAVYAEDIKDQEEVLTYSIPDHNVQNFIPISVMVNKEADLSKMELFINHMSDLKEAEWGLGELNPFNADFHYDTSNQVLAVDFPAATNISSSSQSEAIKEILTDMMADFNIEKIDLLTDGEQGLEMGNEGFTEEIDQVDTSNKSAYYFYYPNEEWTTPFLVPFREKINSVTDAFAAMKKGIETYNLKASIPNDIDFEAEVVSDEQLLITFEDDADIKNDEETLYTIEAILLTAKEFEYNEVKLENTEIDQIGRFDLEKEIQVPVAPNKRDLP